MSQGYFDLQIKARLLIQKMGFDDNIWAVMPGGEIDYVQTLAHECGHLWHLPKEAKKGLFQFIKQLPKEQQLDNELDARATQILATAACGYYSLDKMIELCSFHLYPKSRAKLIQKLGSAKTIAIANQVKRYIVNENSI